MFEERWKFITRMLLLKLKFLKYQRTVSNTCIRNTVNVIILLIINFVITLMISKGISKDVGKSDNGIQNVLP